MTTLVIPGLAMTAAEMPQLDGLVAFDNPELGLGPVFDRDYSIEDAADSVAAAATAYIKAGNSPFDRLVGMSMGGMVAAALAVKHPQLFTPDVTFTFLVTSANTKANPAVTAELMAEFQKAKPGDVASFASALACLFSPAYLASQPETSQRYFKYRAFGKNGQSGKAYFRQVKALSSFDGTTVFPKLDAKRCHFVHGTDDGIFGTAHRDDLKTLMPEARFTLIQGVGHMVNMERPELFAL